MKYIKLFAALLITLLVGAFTATAGYCDAVDDVCSEFGWSYRWTVDVELDDTYDGTWLDQISDDGKLRLSYIMLENTMQTKNADGGTEYIYSLFVAEGEWSVMVTSLDGAASIEKSGSDYLLLSSDNKQSALYNLTRDVDMSEEKSFGLVGCYGYQNDANKRFAVILDYTDTPTLTPDFYASRYTPILISYDVLKEAEDTKADYNSRRTYMRYTQKSALPVVTYLNATAVVREDKKEMFVATPTVEEKVNIKEDAEEVLLEYGIDADYIDRFAHESRRIKSYSLTTARRTPDGVYEIMPMMGRVGKQFYAHVPIGKMEFTVTVDRSRPQADITDDGKLKVTVQMYMRYHAYCREAVQYGIYTDGPALLIKYEGNRGVQYGYDLLKLNRKTASTMMVRYGKYSTVKEYDDELIVIQRLNGSGDDENLYDCPNLYFEFDENTNMLANVGLSFGNGEHAAVTPVEKVQIDEGFELELLTRLLGSKAEARPIVTAARASRGGQKSDVEIDESIMFIPTPETEEKTGEDVEFNADIMFIPVPGETYTPSEVMLRDPAAPPPDEQSETAVDESSSNGYIADDYTGQESAVKLTIKGETVEFDVPPVIENDRVLVPLRAIFEKLGATVVWDGGERSVKIANNSTFIEFEVDNADVAVNSDVKQMDVPARIVRDRTLVPLRFLSEELGYNVIWDAESRAVTVE